MKSNHHLDVIITPDTPSLHLCIASGQLRSRAPESPSTWRAPFPHAASANARVPGVERWPGPPHLPKKLRNVFPPKNRDPFLFFKEGGKGVIFQLSIFRKIVIEKVSFQGGSTSIVYVLLGKVCLELKKIFISTCPLTVPFRKILQLQLIQPITIPAPFRTYYGALCFHNGISPSKMVPRPPRQPLQNHPPFPQGDQGLHPIDLKKVAAKGPRSQGKIRSLLRDLNLLVGG